MAEENITDIVNGMVEEQQEETVEETVDVNTAKEEERHARDQAVNQVRKEAAKTVVKEAKTTMREDFENLKRDYAELKSLLLKNNEKLDGVSRNVDIHSDRLLSDDVLLMEKNLKDDPDLKDIYDPKAVREFYSKKATEEKRYFTPEESLAVLKFKDVLAENKKLKKQINIRQSLMSGAFQNSNNSPEPDGLADVHTPEEAAEYSRKKILDDMGA